MGNKIERKSLIIRDKAIRKALGASDIACSCGGEHVTPRTFATHNHSIRKALGASDIACTCGGEHATSRTFATHNHSIRKALGASDIACTCGGEHAKSCSSNSCGCARCNDIAIDITANSPREKVNHREVFIKLACMATSLITLLCGIFIPLPKYVNLAFFLPSLLLAGGEYMLLALKNLAKGKIFDENFLMTLAAIGAFAIGQYPEGIAVMLLYCVGEMLQDFAVDRSKRNIADMLNLKTPYASKLTGDTLSKISTDAIAIGDVLVVANGEKIPVDGVILRGDSYIDSSMLTGEFQPKHVAVGDEILGGAILQGSSITLQATKIFKDTTCAKILDLVQNSQEKKPKTEQFISKFAKYYTPSVVLIAFIIALLPPAILGFGANFSAYLHKALIFLVISCPCALVISVPLGFFAGIGGASRRGVLFKGGNFMEALNGIDTVVFDKTGTLTAGTFDVTEIVAQDGDKDKLLELCAYAESRSNHPIATSIIKAYAKPIDSSLVSEYEEAAGHGICARYKGEVLLCGSEKLLTDNGILFDTHPTNIGTIINVSLGKDFVGYIVINDKLKDSSEKVIDYLHSIHKKVILMSGDNAQSVSFTADALGIDEYHSSLLPTDKAKLLTDLQNSGHKVAFVGDGLNDAPVLKLASVGICVAGINNDASVEASDIALASSDIQGVITAFKTAKKTRAVVMFNIILALLTKLIIMILGLTVAPSMWLALIADVGVSLIAILNSARAIRIK